MFLRERNLVFNQINRPPNYRRKVLVQPKKKSILDSTRIIPSKPPSFQMNKFQKESIYATENDSLKISRNNTQYLSIPPISQLQASRKRGRTSTQNKRIAKSCVLEPVVLKTTKREAYWFENGFTNPRYAEPKQIHPMRYFYGEEPISRWPFSVDLNPLANKPRYKYPISPSYQESTDRDFRGPSFIPANCIAPPPNPYFKSLIPYCPDPRYLYPEEFIAPNQMFLPLGYPPMSFQPPPECMMLRQESKRRRLPKRQGFSSKNCIVLEGSILHPPSCFTQEDECMFPPKPLWQLHCYPKEDVKPKTSKRKVTKKTAENSYKNYQPNYPDKHQYSLMEEDQPEVEPE